MLIYTILSRHQKQEKQDKTNFAYLFWSVRRLTNVIVCDKNGVYYYILLKWLGRHLNIVWRIVLFNIKKHVFITDP